MSTLAGNAEQCRSSRFCDPISFVLHCLRFHPGTGCFCDSVIVRADRSTGVFADQCSPVRSSLPEINRSTEVNKFLLCVPCEFVASPLDYGPVFLRRGSGSIRSFCNSSFRNQLPPPHFSGVRSLLNLPRCYSNVCRLFLKTSPLRKFCWDLVAIAPATLQLLVSSTAVALGYPSITVRRLQYLGPGPSWQSTPPTYRIVVTSRDYCQQ